MTCGDARLLDIVGCHHARFQKTTALVVDLDPIMSALAARNFIPYTHMALLVGDFGDYGVTGLPAAELEALLMALEKFVISEIPSGVSLASGFDRLAPD